MGDRDDELSNQVDQCCAGLRSNAFGISNDLVIKFERDLAHRFYFLSVGPPSSKAQTSLPKRVTESPSPPEYRGEGDQDLAANHNLLRLREVSQHRVEDAAVAVVLDFDRGVDAAGGYEMHR